MINTKASTVAQRLLNLYRQEHVIIGGWAAVNQVFLSEATPDVLDALRELPTGKTLVRHIENLQNGKTPVDSIERELLPYGGAMEISTESTPVSNAQLDDLEQVINQFTPDENGLNQLIQSPVIQKFGPEWIDGVRNALAGNAALLDKWRTVTETYHAYSLWRRANDIINTPISDRIRAQVQVDMPDYETYLPMFGDAGMQLLARLRTFVSSMKSVENQSGDGAADGSSPSSVTQ